MKSNPTCRVCDVELNEENWYPSCQENREYICKTCELKLRSLWREANPEKVKAIRTKANRKQGHLPFNEHKECSSYLGVHVAERVLSNVFKDVKRMPMNNQGYDVICNRNKLIDIKSSCMWKNGNIMSWSFHINRNTTADFFLCLAFDNRIDLTPLHAWLIPGSKVSHLTVASISKSTIHKWDEYRLDISKVAACCDAMK